MSHDQHDFQETLKTTINKSQKAIYDKLVMGMEVDVLSFHVTTHNSTLQIANPHDSHCEEARRNLQN